jgi:hypothetical protein
VFVTGKTGSGKTSFLWARYLSKAPRVLAIDQTGEWVAREDALGAVVADGLSETLAALREVAGRPRWWVIAVLDNDDIEALAEILLPRGRLLDGPVSKLGGFALYLDEVDKVVGPYGASSLRDLWRRGRHAGLSVLAATQRIGNVSKEVTSQADTIGVLSLHDVADVQYIEYLAGREKARMMLAHANAAPYNVALLHMASGKWEKIRGT